MSRVQMNFRAIGAFDHVAIGDDAIYADEEATAARKFFSARVEGFDGHRGRLDAPNQVRKLILRVCRQREKRKDETGDKRNGSGPGRAGMNYGHCVLSITRAQMFCAAEVVESVVVN